ncbi:MAG: DUF1416 domain-containing protein [Mycobacterium sp.]|nr:DUF1416 domain-containing protein [Mycobacterium sp.]
MSFATIDELDQSPSIDLTKETVITGRVVDGAGQAVSGASVRLLDGAESFTAELLSNADGDFRFFTVPGTWTVWAVSTAGSGDVTLAPTAFGLHEVDVKVA